MIPTPRARSRRTMSNNRRTSASVSAAVGSSMISTRASWLSARRISTRWRLPTDSVPTIASASRSSISSEASKARARRFISPMSMRPNRPFGAWPRKMFSATVNSGNSSSS